MKTSILIVDDEQSMREFLAILLEREGYLVTMADTAESALELLQAGSFALVISDVNMPGLSGIDLLRSIRNAGISVAVLLVTAYSTAEKAVEAMKLGAYDYIAKPFKVEEIKILVRNALEKQALSRENERLRQEVEERHGIDGIVGKSRGMQEVYALVDRVAGSAATVLIYGESGTGKELVAKAVHYKSPRRNRPFVAINCSAIPATLIESELFGYQRGAFTGATHDKQGLFEQADGGTLFLDEIGELDQSLQAKLLRVLQEREIRRVGGKEDVKVDVRLIAASNRDLAVMVKQGAFREDLYFRLNVIDLKLPSLRERGGDIPLLIEHFYRRFSGNPNWTIDHVAPEAMKLLLDYPFPGNVRELENLIERAVVLGETNISVNSLPPAVAGHRTEVSSLLDTGGIPPEGINLEELLEAIERQYLDAALVRSDGVKKRAAELLGLSFRSFRYRLAKLGMDEE